MHLAAIVRQLPALGTLGTTALGAPNPWASLALPHAPGEQSVPRAEHPGTDGGP